MRNLKWLIFGVFGFALLFYKRDLVIYGLTSAEALDNDIIKVVNVLGGGRNAALLLAETAAAESNYGRAVDTTLNSGFGVFQFDTAGYEDVKQRTSNTRKDAVFNAFGVDVNRVDAWTLQYSPLTGAIFCRLFYLLRPGAIPSTLEGRAAYWKKYYNTKLGKGTEAHYIKAAKANRRAKIEGAF